MALPWPPPSPAREQKGSANSLKTVWRYLHGDICYLSPANAILLSESVGLPILLEVLCGPQPGFKRKDGEVMILKKSLLSRERGWEGGERETHGQREKKQNLSAV